MKEFDMKCLGKSREVSMIDYKERCAEAGVTVRMVSFSSAFLFPARKQEAVPQGGIRRIDHPTRKRTQGAGIIKGWEDKRDHGRTPDTFT